MHKYGLLPMLLWGCHVLFPGLFPGITLSEATNDAKLTVFEPLQAPSLAPGFYLTVPSVGKVIARFLM